jgi:hypothetical protein
MAYAFWVCQWVLKTLPRIFWMKFDLMIWHISISSFPGRHPSCFGHFVFMCSSSRPTLSLFLILTSCASFGFYLAFPFCLPCDGSSHWSSIRFLLLFKGYIPITHPTNVVINHPTPLDSKGAKPALGLGSYLIVLTTSDFKFWFFFEFFEII